VKNYKRRTESGRERQDTSVKREKAGYREEIMSLEEAVRPGLEESGGGEGVVFEPEEYSDSDEDEGVVGETLQEAMRGGRSRKKCLIQRLEGRGVSAHGEACLGGGRSISA
jgi:hypothetical protein